jgi:hypothetical protein
VRDYRVRDSCFYKIYNFYYFIGATATRVVSFFAVVDVESLLDGFA